jgi:hypothetical protein
MLSEFDCPINKAIFLEQVVVNFFKTHFSTFVCVRQSALWKMIDSHCFLFTDKPSIPQQLHAKNYSKQQVLSGAENAWYR